MKISIPEGHKPYTPLYDSSRYQPLYSRSEPFEHFDPAIEEYDVIFIGGGPAGRFGASYLHSAGMKVLTIEKDDHLGGKCPKNACVPHHVFFDCAVELDLARWMEGKLWFPPMQGKKVDIRPIMKLFQKGHEPVFDFMFHQSRNQIGLNFFLNTKAEIIDARTVKVGKRIFRTKNLVIATGSGPSPLGVAGENLPGVFNYTNFQSIDYEPKEIVVIGASKVGAPYSSFFNACGMKTTLVEATSFFPALDEDISDYIVHGMRLRGMGLYERSKLVSIEGDKRVNSVVVETPEGKIRIPCDTVFMATGQKPASGVADSLGLEMTKDGAIVVNSRMQTSIPGVYAAGDVTGPPMEMWKARMAGMTAAKNILGETSELSIDSYPDFMHTTYEISWYGLTEKQAREKYGAVTVLKMPIDNYDHPLPLPLAERSVLFGHAFPELSGLQKAIFDSKSRRMVGVWHVGYGAKDGFQYLAKLIDNGLTIDELANLKELFLNPTHFIQLSRLVAGRKQLGDLK